MLSRRRIKGGGMMRGGLALGCGVMMLVGVALGEQETVRHFGAFSGAFFVALGGGCFSAPPPPPPFSWRSFSASPLLLEKLLCPPPPPRPFSWRRRVRDGGNPPGQRREAELFSSVLARRSLGRVRVCVIWFRAHDTHTHTHTHMLLLGPAPGELFAGQHRLGGQDAVRVDRDMDYGLRAGGGGGGGGGGGEGGGGGRGGGGEAPQPVGPAPPATKAG
eukprot:COSAG02_NODE_148_length_33809_cov_158.369594_1_plen_217_part_10